MHITACPRIQRYFLSVAEDRLNQIAQELCRLFNQQIKTISKRTFSDMNEEELGDYDRRRMRIEQLRFELASLERMN